MLEDIDLTERGLNATGNGRILLLACGALAREILDVTKANGWDHLDLHCLPANLHNTPDKITPAVKGTRSPDTALNTIRFSWSMPIAAPVVYFRPPVPKWVSR